MRRMYSDGQVVKVVNKAIDDGEIQAGGLTPEQKEKLDNSLQLPESAPAAQQLVGINTSGEQNALNIGDGLVIDAGALKNGNPKICFIGMGTTVLTSDFEVSSDIYTKLENFYYDIVIIGQAYVRAIVFYKDTHQTPMQYIACYINGNVSVSPSVRGFGVDKVQPIYNDTITFKGNNKIKINETKVETVKFVDTKLNFTGTNGTLSSSNLNKLKNNCEYFPCAYSVSASAIPGATLHNTFYNTNIGYAIFRNIPDSQVSAQYELKITLSDGSWTLSTL